MVENCLKKLTPRHFYGVYLENQSDNLTYQWWDHDLLETGG